MGKYNPCADIRAASHAMRRRFDSLDIGKPSGLTPSQCRIMGFIMDNGGRSVYQKDIERNSTYEGAPRRGCCNQWSIRTS